MIQKDIAHGGNFALLERLAMSGDIFSCRDSGKGATGI